MSESSHDHAEQSPLQSYYDWQVTTIMLARDLHDPIQPGDETAAIARRQEIEDEVRDLTLSIVPQQYKDDPSLDWPAELMREITQLTIRRAAQIVNQ